jgi:cell fate regulator YaaT (PSP1 superfamily)
LPHLVEIAFKGNRKEFFLWDYPEPPPVNAGVIVDVDRGEDFGTVHAIGDIAAQRNSGCAHGCGTGMPDRKALRLANAKDKAQSEELKQLNEDARRKAMEKVRANGLGMKLSDAEWQWDKKKLTLYFTADKRVDFRNLVRDLAGLFRTRIELKQIGVRDEAKRLDGIGRCGRQYCSSAWLPELRPVNLGVAKEQRLSLNPLQISGACGRLMCCLRYEHDFYVQSRRRFPKEGRIVATAGGEEKVMAIDIFRERVTLRREDGETRNITLAEFTQQTSPGAEPGMIAVEEEMSPQVSADEISPDLLYTAEHEIPASARQAIQHEPARPASQPAESPEAAAANRRRRGRRGGRRGRGGSGPANGSAPPRDSGSGGAPPGNGDRK